MNTTDIKGIQLVFSFSSSSKFKRALPTRPSSHACGSICMHWVCISRQMALLDSRLDAYACVCATGWVNGGHLGLAGASVNGTGKRHSAPRTALRCCGALRGADCSVYGPARPQRLHAAAALAAGPSAFPGHPLQLLCPTVVCNELVNSTWQSNSEHGPSRHEAYVWAW